MKNKIVTVLFFGIVMLAALLRFYDLGKNPAGINLDEAAIGYNAYSILKTGRDEYGQYFPLAFRSLDDYKPPLYIYLTVPAVAIFGENEFAVRFPSALLGVGAVILVFFLAKELFKSSEAGIAASLLLAISPWHIQFTRTAYETGSLAFFTSGGLLFFLKGVRGKKWLIVAALFFGLELYLYQSAKVFVPLFVLVLTIINFKKELILFWAVFLVFLIPQTYLSITPQGRLRAWGTSIFQDTKPLEQNLKYKTSDWLRNDNKSATVFHQEVLSYVPQVVNNYLMHLSPQFLFGTNLGLKVNYADNVGLLYLWELPFLISGLFALAKNKKAGLILGTWVLLAPVAVSITTGLPSSIRTAVYLPALQIITAVGIFEIGKRYRFLMPVTLSIGLAFLVYYLHMYYYHAPVSQSKTWYQGYKDIVSESAKLAGNYDRVLVSNRLDQTLNFYLFFLKYDPQVYLKVDGGRISGGFAENQNHLANFYFRQDIEYSKERKTPRTLFVGAPSDFPNLSEVSEPIRKFYFLNGEPSAYIVASD